MIAQLLLSETAIVTDLQVTFQRLRVLVANSTTGNPTPLSRRAASCLVLHSPQANAWA